MPHLLIRSGHVVDGTGSPARRADVLIDDGRILDPLAVVASDGMALAPRGPTGLAGSPHPRSYGCFARVLQDHRDRFGLSLAEAIGKCSSAPAARMCLADRVALARERPADLVVFDQDAVCDLASHPEPRQYPAGIVVVQRAQYSGARPGSILRYGQGSQHGQSH